MEVDGRCPDGPKALRYDGRAALGAMAFVSAQSLSIMRLPAFPGAPALAPLPTVGGTPILAAAVEPRGRDTPEDAAVVVGFAEDGRGDFSPTPPPLPSRPLSPITLEGLPAFRVADDSATVARLLC